MAGWMASAASYLQRCHQAAQEGSVSAAYMEGLDPSHELNSIAQARQALQVHQQCSWLNSKEKKGKSLRFSAIITGASSGSSLEH